MGWLLLAVLIFGGGGKKPAKAPTRLPRLPHDDLPEAESSPPAAPPARSAPSREDLEGDVGIMRGQERAAEYARQQRQADLDTMAAQDRAAGGR